MKEYCNKDTNLMNNNFVTMSNDIKLVLIKESSCDIDSYFLKLPCKQSTIINKNCYGNLCFKFNNFFSIEDSNFFFNPNDPRFNLEYVNSNLSYRKKMSCLKKGIFNLVNIDTDNNEISNKICFLSICIPVKPNGILNHLINKQIFSLLDIGEFFVK